MLISAKNCAFITGVADGFRMKSAQNNLGVVLSNSSISQSHICECFVLAGSANLKRQPP